MLITVRLLPEEGAGGDCRTDEAAVFRFFQDKISWIMVTCGVVVCGRFVGSTSHANRDGTTYLLQENKNDNQRYNNTWQEISLPKFGTPKNVRNPIGRSRKSPTYEWPKYDCFNTETSFA